MKRTVLRSLLGVFACVVFCAAMLINVSIINGHKPSFTAQAFADDESTGSDCCPWYANLCIKRVESIKVHCGGTVIKSIKYYSESTKITVVGTATLNETTGQLTITSGYMTGYTTYTETTIGGYDATKVNCPTDGKCYICVEYLNPCASS